MSRLVVTDTECAGKKFLRNGDQDFLRHDFRFRRMMQSLQQNNELIACQACHRIGIAHHVLKTQPELVQNFVSDSVAEGAANGTTNGITNGIT